VCPNGDDGNKPNFLPRPTYIDLIVRDTFGAPMAGIPVVDITATVCAACGGTVSFADAPTDVAGHTTMTATKIGGCCPVAPVIVQTVLLANLEYRSYDDDGDLSVDLSDLTRLGWTYNKCFPGIGYNQCFDFTCDECVDLSDLTVLGKHYNHDCTFPLP
jgi:hypothetical protein